jgi:hypothetical protein
MAAILVILVILVVIITVAMLRPKPLAKMGGNSLVLLAKLTPEQTADKNYLNWCILEEGRIVGHVAVRPTGLPEHPGSQFTCEPAHLTEWAWRQLARKRMVTPVYSFVDLADEALNHAMEKIGKYQAREMINNTYHNVYVLRP